MPNVADLDKDALAALIKQLYEQSCSVFADKFNMEHEVRTLVLFLIYFRFKSEP
jgi:hypothetical protein